jgi:hypothetical protein
MVKCELEALDVVDDDALMNPALGKSSIAPIPLSNHFPPIENRAKALST